MGILVGDIVGNILVVEQVGCSIAVVPVHVQVNSRRKVQVEETLCLSLDSFSLFFSSSPFLGKAIMFWKSSF